MRGFAVYWNTRSRSELGSLPLEQLLKEMARYEEITAGKEPLTYIVSPVTLEVKLTHHEGSADPATPVYVLRLGNVLLPSVSCVHWDHGLNLPSISICQQVLGGRGATPTPDGDADGAVRAGHVGASHDDTDRHALSTFRHTYMVSPTDSPSKIPNPPKQQNRSRPPSTDYSG